MTITRKQVADKFNVNITDVEQVKSQQLFIIIKPDSMLLVSYLTIVGKYINGVWYLTKQKYSVSTSRQMSTFARTHNVKYVNDINNITEQEL